MNQDNDVERLFSWLQTPDIRYREFASAREVTDAVVTMRSETNTPVIETPPSRNTQLNEEYPEDQFPDQSQTVIKVEPARELAADAPVAAAPPEPVRREPTIVAPAPLPPTQPPETRADQQTSATPEPTAESYDEQKGRSLDSVFNRLAGGGSGVPDPRDRSRTGPGSGPPGGRPR
jgi:hypothetical protein